MKVLRGIIVLSLLLLFSVTAYAGDVVYMPSSMTVVVSPGASATIMFDASLPEGGGFYFIRFVDEVEGTLPISWLDVSPPFTWQLPASVTLNVNVPPGTAPNTYSGKLISSGYGGAHEVDKNNFILHVVVPSECNSVPSFGITSIGPDNLWAPNNSMQEVTLKGHVDMPKGCTIYQASYTIDDEYGECSREGNFTIDSDGEFAVSIPVEASRKGNDKDGRLYIIVLSAENESGIGTSKVIDVHVGHDQSE